MTTPAAAALDQHTLFSGSEPEAGGGKGRRAGKKTGAGKSERRGAKKSRGRKSPDSAQPPVPEDIFAGVTDAQALAIEHEDGPMLVLAGAGSGKTRVITRRIARLVQKGVPPRSILSITFTNKAAGEMGARVAALVGGGGAWVSTFHSFCASLLRRDIVKLGYPRDFTIYDGEDSEACVKEALGQAGAPADMKPARVLSQISRWKSALVGPDQAYSLSSGPDGWRRRVMAEAYRVYEELLRARKALDFDDLLLKALELLRVHADVREKWHRRFSHLQVDEYQDTNRIQYELVKALAGERRNVVVVGDPDQSIYSWRGAEPGNVDGFCRDFKDARIVRLDMNFRSKQAILDAASSLMGARGSGAGHLTGVRGPGEKPKLLITSNAAAEAEEICRRIDWHIRAGRSARELAVFYRTNAQSREFEQAFMARGVPYVVVGAVAFYQRREVKDALAYLRVAMNPSDDVGFARIVNTPRRGLGAAALGKLESAASERRMPLAEAAHDPSVRELAGARPARSLAELDAILGRLAGLVRGAAGPAVRAAVVDTGLRAFYVKSREDDRVDNLDELANAAFGYDAIHSDSGLEEGEDGAGPVVEPGAAVGLAGFLEEAALVSDFDRWDEARERVALMTLHAAKGLEFPCVFIAGLEEGLLPHIRVIAEGDERGFDEGRRLLYVGMTRAQDELTLSLARSRARGGQAGLRIRSRFLNDVPAEMLQVENLAGAGADGASAEGEAWESRARPGFGRRLPARRRRDDFPPDEPPPDEDSVALGRARREALEAMEEAEHLEAGQVEVGMDVVHPQFGRGKVVAIKGYGSGAKVTIRFPELGRKTVSLGFTRLARG